MAVKGMPEFIGVFDTETDGPNPLECRLVTAFIGKMRVSTGVIEQRWSWIVDTGQEIPKGASDVHGYTTERIAKLVRKGEARPVSERGTVIFEIIQKLDVLDRQGIPIVVMNAPFDFTLIDRETERHWPRLRPLMNLNDEGWISRPTVIDPMVLDKAIDKYRKGKRKLVDLAAFYRVPVEENAHDAEADCRMAGRVAIKLLEHSRFDGMTLAEIHKKTIPTKRAQSTGPDGLAQYWETKVIPQLRVAVKTAERAGDPVALQNAIDELDEKIAAAANVRATGHYWPMIPRDINPEGASA
jgi:DNA polymerase-3 subunit epsilon